ncbi:MAG: helix-turn-helix transcriptional regulator [Halodesulfurarchaeum sp.]
MRRSPPVVPVLVLGLVLASVVGPSVASARSEMGVSDLDLRPEEDTVAQTRGFALAISQPKPDNTITRIYLRANGSAIWEITFRTRLATDTQRREFEAFQDAFRENTSRYLAPFKERISRVVAQANETVPRDMRARNFSATTSIQQVPQRWGIVTFRFTWDGFANTKSDRVIVGDVFNSGFYLSADGVLAIYAPPGYTIAESDPPPDVINEGFVEWHGREDFGDNRPRVVAVPEREPTTETTGDPTTGTTARPPAGSDSGGFGPLLIGGLLGAGVLLVVGYALYTGAIGGPTAGDDEEPPSSGSQTAIEEDRSSDSGTDTALLTDEDRVRRVLQAEGGRMKQSAIVEELDWSKSKTSRVLSQMEEDGEIEKLRIGRENVIDLVEE